MLRINMLKSIAHNTAHSYLSLMNYIDGDYTVERIFKIAKRSEQTSIEIDILNKTIEPQVFSTPQIKVSLDYLIDTFVSLLSSEEIPLDYIQSAKIKINFDLQETKQSRDVPGLEFPKYKCVSEIIDRNGKSYSKEVVEWWKY